MNKKEFISELAKNTEMTKTACAEMLETFLALVPEVLVDEGKLQFPGFGTFTLNERKARKGRNPATGESIDIPATNQVKFKVGASLKAAVNE